jgi:hypothetical protein
LCRFGRSTGWPPLLGHRHRAGRDVRRCEAR